MARIGGFWKVLITLLFVGLLAMGGMLLFRAGWDQGYTAAALTNGGQVVDGGRAVLPHTMPYFGYGRGFFNPFGPLMGIGIFLLVLFLIGGLFRFFGWRRWSGHSGHPYWGHGPVPPWAQDWKQQPPQPAEKKDPPDETKSA